LDLVFFGTSEFAVPPLEAVLRNKRHQLKLCVTQPDRPKGRGQTFMPSPVKVCAQKYKVPLMQPKDLNDMGLIKKLGQLCADVFIVAAYGVKLKPEVLELPRKASLNIHGSLLPKYRGAAPIQRAIWNGETETGITLIRMNERIDAGNIFLKRKLTIGKHEDASQLSARLADLSAEILTGFLADLEVGRFQEAPQDESQATYAAMLKKSDGMIDWTRSAKEVDAQIRAVQPWPSAFTTLAGKRLKVLRGKPTQCAGGYKPGAIVTATKQGIHVACGADAYSIERLQPESGRAMDSEAFLSGNKLRSGARLGSG